ncbi:MAG: FHA domain-containing protein [Bryobacteraceae bacterium]
MTEIQELHAYLVRVSGPLAGSRYPVHNAITRIGRSPQNDVPIEEAAVVSLRHAEIRKDESGYTIRDLNSTNGTYINGVRIEQGRLQPPCAIQLGAGGPQLSFSVDKSSPVDLNRTLEAPARSKILGVGEHRDLVAEALARVRRARWRGDGRDRRLAILQELVRKAVHRSRRKFKIAIVFLVSAVLGLAAFSFRQIRELRSEKRNIDAQIRTLEARLKNAGKDPAQTDELMEQLSKYEARARGLESSFIYRMGVREPSNPIEQEVKSLMAEFGAETYSLPPELLEEVDRYVRQYQSVDRPRIVEALGQAHGDIETVRAIFRHEHLPPDLAYMVVVEGAIGNGARSGRGAAGMWQLTASTARGYGLRVDGAVDERLDIRKATKAACQYMRELILDFGAGSSVMLAIAAFNSGPAKVKQAVRAVRDPIKQRNFWYLFRIGALPPETREYVPKVLAVLIIARNPTRFGF